MTIVAPSDETSTRWLTRYAVEHYGPTYIRISRESHPDIYAEGESFQEGKGKIVREGDDVTIVACGVMVGKAIEAADILKAKGISARVVDMLFIKPIDEELIEESAKKTGAVVTAEEHNIYGGLGGAVCEVLCREGACVPVGSIGLRDTHGESGPYARLQEKYGLDAAAIAREVRCVLQKKNA